MSLCFLFYYLHWSFFSWQRSQMMRIMGSTKERTILLHIIDLKTYRFRSFTFIGRKTSLTYYSMQEDKHIILRSMWKGIKNLIRTIKLDFLKRKEENSVVLEYKWMQIKQDYVCILYSTLFVLLLFESDISNNKNNIIALGEKVLRKIRICLAQY